MIACVCGCGRQAAHLHHVVYQQHIDVVARDDPRNLVPVAFTCHGAHHGRSRPLSLHMLPASAFAFASEQLGAGYAYEYLRRRYSGDDLRLERLLEEAA